MALTIKQVGYASIVPFVVGLLLSLGRVIPPDTLIFITPTLDSVISAKSSSSSNSTTNPTALVSERRRALLDAEYQVTEGGGDPFLSVTLSLHRNGEKDPCDIVSPGELVMNALYAESASTRRKRENKYEWESTLTKAFSSHLLSSDEQCPSARKTNSKNWFGRKNNKNSASTAFLGFCDAGPEKTPILLDHKKMVGIPITKDGQKSLPCHFHTREGVRITSVAKLLEAARDKLKECSSANADGDEQGTCSADAAAPNLELYAVPAGRVFMFAPKFVGEIFKLPHVKGSELPIHLEVMSLTPRVFDVINFFSKTESDSIVKKALNEKSESHRIKRSSTGASGYNLNSQRTSENGFDTHGRDAMTVKRRCFDVLGFDEYVEGMADGLQVLRYNQTTAYIPHLDWIDDYQKREEHDFDSENLGSNRFATVLLYMSDLPDDGGGETVFAKGWPSYQKEEDRVEIDKALEEVRDLGIAEASNLKRDSWEEKMVAQCRSRLSVKPNSARAVLFYSQHPDGRPDQSSLHGGCPVLKGSKWAANLWVWNAVRGGYDGSPVNQDVVDRNRKKRGGKDPPGPKQLKATFHNTGKNPALKTADLYFQETFWGKFGPSDPPLSVNTYEGHEWNVMVDGKVVDQFIIGKKNENFSV